MIPSETTDLITAQSTHEGETGKNNEDRLIVGAFRENASRAETVTLAMVADGIGGHAAGEIASDLAVRTVYEFLEKAPDSRDPLGVLQSALLAANQAIYERSRSEPQLAGMGSTAVVALIVGRRLFVAHVGDSRMYLIREGRIRQLTVDHTWVQEAISAGLLTPDDARKHPNRHVIRRYLGHNLDTNPVDLGVQLVVGEAPEHMTRNQGMTLQDGDMLLLCSDGLTDLVEDDEILSAVLDHSPQEATDQLVLLARQRGGFDNITIVLVKAPARPGGAAPTRLSPAAAASGKRQPRRSRTLVVGVVVAAVLLLLVAAGVVAGLLYFQGQAAPAPTPTPVLPTDPPPTAGAALPPGDTPTETPVPTDTPAPTATTAATETATLEATAPDAYVTANNSATIRYGPDPVAAIVGELAPGETAVVHGRDADGRWWYIEYPAGTASRGWVFRTAVTLTGLVDDIPVVDALGTPQAPAEDTGSTDGAATATGTPQG